MPTIREFLDSYVVQKDKWIYIDGVFLADDLMDFPGCYVVFKKFESRPVYIGKSINPRLRFYVHSKSAPIFKYDKFKKSTSKLPWGNADDIYIKIKYPKKSGYESILEKRLINKLKPVFNRKKY
jgi:hypothetical protein